MSFLSTHQGLFRGKGRELLVHNQSEYESYRSSPRIYNIYVFLISLLVSRLILHILGLFF